jgi:DNA-binding IclR family transcriptional regulator
MERLHELLGETVDCSVLDGNHVLFVDQIPGRHRLRAVSVVGSNFPLHSTANGKAVLAELSSEEVSRLLRGRLKRYTEKTITNPAALARELAAIREAGVALDHEEHTIGISAAGVALRDPSGDFAALTVPMPTQRFVGHEDEIAKALLEVKRDVEATFGFTGA